MNVADIRKLYAYTEWANDRIIGVIAPLSEEQFTRNITSSYSSLRETLAHIAVAEWLWLERWKGNSPAVFPDWAKDATLETLRAHMHAIAADRRGYLAGLGDDAIPRVLHYSNMAGEPFSMPLGEVLLHCANHSTYHRGQLVTMLRQAGATSIPSTDYTQFLRSA